MKTVKTEIVQNRVWGFDPAIQLKPKYELGQTKLITSGHWEGTHGIIVDIAYNTDDGCFEYQIDHFIGHTWVREIFLW